MSFVFQKKKEAWLKFFPLTIENSWMPFCLIFPFKEIKEVKVIE